MLSNRENKSSKSTLSRLLHPTMTKHREVPCLSLSDKFFLSIWSTQLMKVAYCKMSKPKTLKHRVWTVLHQRLPLNYLRLLSLMEPIPLLNLHLKLRQLSVGASTRSSRPNQLGQVTKKTDSSSLNRLWSTITIGSQLLLKCSLTQDWPRVELQLKFRALGLIRSSNTVCYPSARLVTKSCEPNTTQQCVLCALHRQMTTWRSLCPSMSHWMASILWTQDLRSLTTRSRNCTKSVRGVDLWREAPKLWSKETYSRT